MTTNPLTTSTDSARSVAADAIIIGITQGPDGPVLAPGAQDVDAALGGTLGATLAALGATGKQDEITKLTSGGQLAAPLVAAVGLGDLDADGPLAAAEALRRGAGAAVRALAGSKAAAIALALPARDEAETGAVALGAVLGTYRFGRYRSDAKTVQPALTVLTSTTGAAAAADRAVILADAITLTRDLVNTSPSHLYPESFAAQARRDVANILAECRAEGLHPE